MSDFEVYDNPDSAQKARRNYPWSEMQVGQSFFVPDIHVRKMGSAAANSKMTQVRGWKFSCKTKNGGVEVTRVK
jgi:hypothetical protein